MVIELDSHTVLREGATCFKSFEESRLHTPYRHVVEIQSITALRLQCGDVKFALSNFFQQRVNVDGVSGKGLRRIHGNN